MSSLTEAAAAAKEKMQQQNPSNAPGKPAAEMKRIPLSLPVQKLEVPEIPGYHLHWFRGTSARIQQAQRAGFEFVKPEEVKLNNLALGGDASKSGNSDMGDRVSVVAGDIDDQGQAVRLYLMKQPMEYYLQDKALLQQRNDSIADAMTAAFRDGSAAQGAGLAGERQEDVANRYVARSRTKIPELFRRKGPK